MRIWSVAVGALLLVVAAVVVSMMLSGGDDEPAVDPPVSTLAADRAEPEMGRPIEAAPLPTSPTTASERTEVPAIEPAEADTDHVTIDGTVLMTDSLGTTHTDVSGTLRLKLTGDGSSHTREVKVTAGSFRLQVPAGTVVLTSWMELNQRTTLPVGAEPIEVTGPTRMEVRGFWPPGPMLHVLDARTREPLEQVTVLRCDESSERDYVRPTDPGRHHIVVEDQPSPVELGGKIGWTRTYWCRAPGYSWSRIHIDHRTSGERQVLLQPSSRLEIALVGHEPERDAVLRLRRGGSDRSELVYQLAPPAAEFPIADLDSGSYHLSVEVGKRWDSPLVLASTSLELFPGESRQISLTLSNPALDTALVPLSGTLILPLAWGEPEGTLSFRLLEQPEVRQNRSVERKVADLTVFQQVPRAFRWNAGLVAPGRIEYQLETYGFGGEIEVGADGEQDVQLVVAAPAQLFVRVVEAKNGTPVLISQLLWRPLLDGGKGGAAYYYSLRKESAEFELKVPIGRLVLLVFGEDGYGFVNQIVDVRAGRNETRIELTRACELRIELYDGEALVPYERSSEFEIEEIGGDGRGTGSSSDSRTITWILTEPGLYQVSIPAPAGFRPIEPIQFLVEQGKENTLKVQLQRG